MHADRSIELRPNTTDPRVGTTFVHEGWTIHVETEVDAEAADIEDDSISPRQIVAYQRGEWHFATCTVTAAHRGIVYGSATLWGVREGLYPYTDRADRITARGHVGPRIDAVDDLVREAVRQAHDTLAHMNERAAG